MQIYKRTITQNNNSAQIKCKYILLMLVERRFRTTKLITLNIAPFFEVRMSPDHTYKTECSISLSLHCTTTPAPPCENPAPNSNELLGASRVSLAEFLEYLCYILIYLLLLAANGLSC